MKGGQSKSNNSLTRLLPSRTSRDAFQSAPPPPPLLSVCLRRGKKRKGTSSGDEQHLKSFNCNPDATCAALVGPPQQSSAPLETRVFGEARAVVTSVTPRALYTRRDSLLMRAGASALCARASFCPRWTRERQKRRTGAASLSLSLSLFQPQNCSLLFITCS